MKDLKDIANQMLKWGAITSIAWVALMFGRATIGDLRPGQSKSDTDRLVEVQERIAKSTEDIATELKTIRKAQR